MARCTDCYLAHVKHGTDVRSVTNELHADTVEVLVEPVEKWVRIVRLATLDMKLK